MAKLYLKTCNTFGGNCNLVLNPVTTATETQSLAGHGVKWEIKTTDNGTIIPTAKIKCDSQGVTINNAYTLPNVQGITGSFMVSDGSGQAYWDTNVHAEVSISNNSTPTSLSTDTWAPPTGTRTNGLNSGFTPSGTSVTYDGGIAKVFRLSVSASWECEGKDKECVIAVFKNGSLIPSTEQRGSIDDGGKFPRNITAGDLVGLSQTDSVSVQIKNTETSDDMTIRWMNFTITQT